MVADQERWERVGEEDPINFLLENSGAGIPPSGLTANQTVPAQVSIIRNPCYLCLVCLCRGIKLGNLTECIACHFLVVAVMFPTPS